MFDFVANDFLNAINSITVGYSIQLIIIMALFVIIFSSIFCFVRR